MWQKLASNMAFIIKQYQQLLALGKEKHKVLVAVDIKSLESVINREQEYITAVNKAEKTRQSIIKELSVTDVRISSSMKMYDVLQQCRDSVQKEQLEKLHIMLGQLVKEVNAVNEENTFLTKAALNAVNFKLNQLGGLSVEQGYGNRGQEQVSHQKNFDFRA